MKNVPHWQLFVVMYFCIVAVPVYLIHSKLKNRAFGNRTFSNLLLYFFAVLVSGFLLHYLLMWLYFTFFFPVRN